jgi:putative DNA primase/helicase
MEVLLMNETPKDAARRLASGALREGFKPQALYEYTDINNTPLHWRIRLKNPLTNEKWIRPMKLNGASYTLGEPEYSNGKPLYRLHDLMTRPSDTVVVVEGEWCVSALLRIGALATTSGAADTAESADWSIMAGRTVTIFPDNDDAGRRYAEAVRSILLKMNCTVRIIDIDALGLPPKGDVVDWLKANPAATFVDILALPIIGNAAEKTERIGSDLSLSNDASEATPLPENTAQPDTPHAQSDDEKIQWLASLKPLDYDRVRKEQASALGVQVKTLDEMVKQARSNENETSRLPFDEIEPYPEPIDPAQLLDVVSDTIRQYIVLDAEQAHTAALWVALTWFIDVVEIAPLAIINAPEKSCGKTQLLTVLGRLSYRPLLASNASASALFRDVEKWKPTILIDEADTFFRDNAELHGMVNAGYLRDGFVLRSEAVGDSFEPRMFSVFSAKALAGIALEKHLPDATMSRGIVFNLRRKLSHESVSRLRHADRDLFSGIAEKLARFAMDYSKQVRQARSILPDALSDRDQDNWDGLLAIASCAGAEWVTRATEAALTLSGAGEKTVSTGNELLADIQHVFDSKRVDKISTADLIAALCADDELSWSTYNRGKQLSPKQLSNRLKGYGITSRQMRLNAYDNPARGFDREQFNDAFLRYLPNPPNLPLHVTKSLEANKDVGFDVTDRKACNVTEILSVTFKPNKDVGCNAVTDRIPFSGDGSATLPNLSRLRV